MTLSTFSQLANFNIGKIITFYILFLTSTCVCATSSNNNPPQFGTVSKEELKSTFYPKNKNAKALYIYDMGFNQFIQSKHGFEMKLERRVRIKIFSKDAFKEGNIRIPFLVKNNGTKEEILDIEAYTYNLSGEEIIKTKVKEEDIFEETTTENICFKKFIFPNIKVGSVIEYKYTITSPFIKSLYPWVFQHSNPVKWSEYQLNIPPYFEYIVATKNISSFDIEETKEDWGTQFYKSYEYKDQKFRWVKKDVPAFIEESFISKKEEYLSIIKFTLKRVNFPDRTPVLYQINWPTYVNQLLKNSSFGDRLGKKSSKKLVQEIVQNTSGNLEKARSIYDYVKNNFTFNNRLSIFPSASTKDLLEGGEGNVADINLELTNMLSLANLDTKPVLTSTSSNGTLNKQYPHLAKFNYILVQLKIGKETFLLDATNKLLPFGVIPEFCSGEEGLLLDKKESFHWINLDSGIGHDTFTTIAMSYQPDEDKLTTFIRRKSSGYSALEERLLSKSETQFLKEDIPEIDFKDLKIVNLEVPDKPLISSAKYEKEIETTGEMVYINPFITDRLLDNPFKAMERTYPIDFGFRKNQKYQYSLKIPEGYEILEIPKPLNLILPDKSVSYSLISKMDQISGSVQIIYFFVINQSVINQENYQELKNIYTQIINSQNSHIVLKKKNK